MKKRFYFFLVSCAFLLSACSGYRLIDPIAGAHVHPKVLSSPVYIKPIKDDIYGDLALLTSVALTKRGFILASTEKHADLILTIQLKNQVEENLGFTYAPNAQTNTTHKHFIVSNEGRLSSSAQICLIKKSSGDIVLDRWICRHNVTFDFEPDLGLENAQNLALGQYEMHGEACKPARYNLYQSLAEAIAQRIYYDLF